MMVTMMMMSVMIMTLMTGTDGEAERQGLRWIAES